MSGIFDDIALYTLNGRITGGTMQKFTDDVYHAVMFAFQDMGLMQLVMTNEEHGCRCKQTLLDNMEIYTSAIVKPNGMESVMIILRCKECGVEVARERLTHCS